MDEFQKDLQAVFDKHGKTLYPVPNFVQGPDGFWHPSAEIRIVPITPKEAPESVIKEA